MKKDKTLTDEQILELCSIEVQIMNIDNEIERLKKVRKELKVKERTL